MSYIQKGFCIYPIKLAASTVALLAVTVLLFPVEAVDMRGDLIIIRPECVESFNVPESLVSNHPHEKAVLITFVPVNHGANLDGTALLPGEGSYPDRGMKPLDPQRILFYVPDADAEQVVKSLRTSGLAFQYSVVDSEEGYYETQPASSPDLKPVGAIKISHVSVDDELNACYQSLAIKESADAWYKVALRNSERAWLKYRDASAVLAGLAAGNGDELARAQQLRVVNQAREKDLEHFQVNDLPWDFNWVPPSTVYGNPAEQGQNPLSDRYNWYRAQLVNRKAGKTLGAWIATQKAWNDYSNQEAIFEVRQPLNGLTPNRGLGDVQLMAKVHVLLQRRRWADMNIIAMKLGLSAHPADPSQVPDVDLDQETIAAPSGEFRIELSPSGINSQKATVYSNLDNSSQDLPDPNSTGDTSKSNYYASDCYISPDSKWIFDITSRAHTNREAKTEDAFVYSPVSLSPIHLESVPGEGPSMGQLALKRFHHDSGQIVYLYFGNWSPDELHFIYTTRTDTEPDTDNDAVDYRCTFSLAHQTFSEAVRIPGYSEYYGGR